MFVLYFLTICNLINNTLEISAKISADIFISIHTSAREVTMSEAKHTLGLAISIHTSAREVTELSDTINSAGIEFQSTLPRGKWQLYAHGIWICNHISIHTSAREVTTFQVTTAFGTAFQSTLPQGKWPYSALSDPNGLNFNPHFRKGSDRELCPKLRGYTQFQSTLPQGKWLNSEHW